MIQLQNHQNVKKKKQFWQKVPDVNGLTIHSYGNFKSLKLQTSEIGEAVCCLGLNDHVQWKPSEVVKQ